MQTKGEYTPGPWAFKMVPDTPEERVGIDDPTGIFLCHHDPEDVFGCGGSFLEGGFVDGSRDEMVANARLIAAAPELLEAAEAAEKLIDDMARFVGQMALRDYALFNEAPIMLRAAIAKAKGLPS